MYRCGADGSPAFIDAASPTDDELHALLQSVIERLMKLLTRRGVLVEDMGQAYLAEPDADGEEARTLRPLQAAAVAYRIAFGPRAGQKVLTLRGAMPREDRARQPLCADIDGFGLYAAVRVEAHDRKRLEQLGRYITRPALSDERVQLNAAGQVELKLKTPWRDGTTHLVMSPLEFMQRLAALVPRPRLHLIRFHGVLAPNAKHRPLVVPQEPHVQEAASEATAAAECEVETAQARPQRISWVRQLKRVVDIDMQHCPNCGGGKLLITSASSWPAPGIRWRRSELTLASVITDSAVSFLARPRTHAPGHLESSRADRYSVGRSCEAAAPARLPAGVIRRG